MEWRSGPAPLRARPEVRRGRGRRRRGRPAHRLRAGPAHGGALGCERRPPRLLRAAPLPGACDGGPRWGRCCGPPAQRRAPRGACGPRWSVARRPPLDRRRTPLPRGRRSRRGRPDRRPPRGGRGAPPPDGLDGRGLALEQLQHEQRFESRRRSGRLRSRARESPAQSRSSPVRGARGGPGWGWRRGPRGAVPGRHEDPLSGRFTRTLERGQRPRRASSLEPWLR